MGVINARFRAIESQPHLATASGGIAHFESALSLPFASCVVTITPSTTGKQGIVVTRSGSNMLDLSKATSGYIEGNGNIYSGTDPYEFVCTTYYPLSGGQTIIGSMNQGAEITIGVYNPGTKSFDSRGSSDAPTQHLRVHYGKDWLIRFGFCPKPNKSHANVGEFANEQPQVTFGEVVPDYEAYNGTDYAIAFPATVYGGTVDLVNGVLTSTTGANGSALSSPVTYQITPVSISTLNGVNNIWSDCGSVAVSYWTH